MSFLSHKREGPPSTKAPRVAGGAHPQAPTTAALLHAQRRHHAGVAVRAGRGAQAADATSGSGKLCLPALHQVGLARMSTRAPFERPSGLHSARLHKAANGKHQGPCYRCLRAARPARPLAGSSAQRAALAPASAPAAPGRLLGGWRGIGVHAAPAETQLDTVSIRRREARRQKKLNFWEAAGKPQGCRARRPPPPEEEK
jgi:hypothetical protein